MGYDLRCLGKTIDFCNFLYILKTFDKMHNIVLERYKLKCPLPLFSLFDYPSGEQASRVIEKDPEAYTISIQKNAKY